MERTDKHGNPLNRIPKDEHAGEHEPWTCGSCHWARMLMQAAVIKPACTALPRQVIVVGNTVIAVNPPIDDPKAGCAMWKPKPNGEDHAN